MRYELTDHEWAAIKPMLRNKPRGIPRVNDRRVLNGTFWVLRSGAPWRDLPPGLLTAGEAHDNRLANELLSRPAVGSMLLADRGYDADWGAAPEQTSRQRATAMNHSASARIFTRPEIWSNGPSTRSNTVDV